MRLSEVARESEMECKQLLQQVTSLRHTVADNKEQLEEYELQVADYSRSLDVHFYDLLWHWLNSVYACRLHLGMLHNAV